MDGNGVMLVQNDVMNITEGVLFTFVFVIAQLAILCQARRSSSVWNANGKQIVIATQGVLGPAVFAYLTRIFAPKLQFIIWSDLTFFRMFWWATVFYVVHLRAPIPVAISICTSVCALLLEAIWHIFFYMFAIQSLPRVGIPIFMIYNLFIMAGFLSQVAIFRMFRSSSKIQRTSFFEKAFKWSVCLLGISSLMFMSIPHDLSGVSWNSVSFGVYDMLKQVILVFASFMTLESEIPGSIFFTQKDSVAKDRPSDDTSSDGHQETNMGVTNSSPQAESMEEDEIQTPIKPCLLFSSSWLGETHDGASLKDGGVRYSPKSFPPHSTSTFEFDRADLTKDSQQSSVTSVPSEEKSAAGSQGSIPESDFVVRDQENETRDSPPKLPHRTIRFPPPLKSALLPASPLAAPPSPPPGSPLPSPSFRNEDK